jgi:hypothetical protein
LEIYQKMKMIKDSMQNLCWIVMMMCIMKANRSVAQDTAAVVSPDTAIVKNKWHFLVEPYVMFPKMHGTTGLGGLPNAPVDENPGDIFRNLQFGAMLYAEGRKGFWTFSSDLTYMHLKSDANINDAAGSGTVDIKQLAWELAGMRQLAPWFELGLAFQLNNIKSDVDLFINTSGGVEERTSQIDETWVDPSILTRVKFGLSKKWSFQFRGNIGGGGIGSDLYWQLQGYFGYRFSKLFQLSAGYRAIYIDYETGSGDDRFVYDMTTFGPVVRFGFNLK